MNFDNIVLLVLRLKIIKMIRITNLIILSILFFVFQVSGINFPDFWFEHITIADGLSQNYITDIKQDKDRLIWIGTKNGLNKYDGYEMTIYNHIQNDSTSIPNNYISYIYQDSKDNLWIGTNTGLCKYISEKDCFEQFNFETTDSPHSNYNISSLFEDKNNILWIGTEEGCLISFDLNTEGVKIYRASQGIKAIEQDKSSLLIGGRNKGIMHFDPIEETFYQTSIDSTFNSETVTTIATDPKGDFWIGTQSHGIYLYGKNLNKLSGQTILDIHFYKDSFALLGTEEEGLACYNIDTDEFQYINNTHENVNLNSEGITSLYVDSTQTIWIGTINGGINKFDPNRNRFAHLSLSPKYNTPSTIHCVFALETLDNKSILAGLNTKGVYSLDSRTYEIDNTAINRIAPQLSETTINTILKDSRGLLWLGTYKKSLIISGPRNLTEPINKLIEKSLSPSSSIKSLYEDSQHRIWIGTDNSGLFCYDPKLHTLLGNTKELKKYIYPNLITSVIEDDNHQLWVATNCGLYLYDPEEDSFTRNFLANQEQPYSLANTIIPICPIQDTLWLGTRQGLIKYSPKEQKHRIFQVEDGLPSESIKGLLHDEPNNKLWISTDRGLSCLNLSSYQFINFGLKDGIVGTEFNDMSFEKGADGTFFFGCVDGIYCFRPDQIKMNPYAPGVIITHYRLYDDSPQNKTNGDISRIPVPSNKEITIPFKQSIFSIDFVALNYTNTPKNQYAYKLENYDNNWHYVGTQHMATYTNLNPGSYLFRVKASNNDGVWNEKGASLKITILPPWWRTTWAYFIYTIIIGGIIFISIRIYTNRLKMQNQLNREQFERAQLEKLNQLKSQFFSNITHEFRTPLTLIISPLEAISNTKGRVSLRENYLTTIKNNAYKLLDLVNRLLDFSKVESGCFTFNPINIDIISSIKHGVAYFQPLAGEKNITLIFHADKDDFVCSIDPNIIEKILYNLISNAIKYTPENGTVEVCVTLEKGNLLSLSVKDTGKGIPVNKQKVIFDRFYQLDGDIPNGTGIGLSLVKSLVELHHGSIDMESEVNKGTIFTIHIPYKNATTNEVIIIPTGEKNNRPNKEKDRAYLTKMLNEQDIQETNSSFPTILIAEDNHDLREFIKSILNNKYNVIEAENGAIALDIARKDSPDIIISDILMPEMDGKQLCVQIKQDIQTCHIPFIMITALSSETDQIEGLTVGADDYITKPFNPEILKTKIKNVLKSRELISRRYATLSALEPEEFVTEDKDATFLLEIIEFIKANVSNPDLKVDDLSKNAGMSRSPFFKKLKNLTGKTPNDFIRDIRLNQAAKLLLKSDLNITEIAYQTGFTSPKYFRECFKKQFGESPSQYIENKKSLPGK